MRRLRAPEGCPWDREQTLETLRAYLIEETYEVLEAIEDRDPASLREELGDLLLEVVFLSQVCAEASQFSISDVVEGITDKLIRRHPHVFGDRRAGSARDAIRNWEEIKNREKKEKIGTTGSVLEGVPRALPALLRAARLSEKASLTGFDWSRFEDLLDKMEEEASEFRDAAEREDGPAMTEELGDLLFIVANLGRFCGIDPESALQSANAKFISRFRHIEGELARDGQTPFEAPFDRMEQLWNEAKARERRAQGPGPDPGGRRKAPEPGG